MRLFGIKLPRPPRVRVPNPLIQDAAQAKRDRRGARDAALFHAPAPEPSAALVAARARNRAAMRKAGRL